MAVHNFSITSYTVKLSDKLDATFGGTAIKARGIVSCQGSDNKRVIGYFLTDDSPVPSPTTTVGGNWGPVFLPMDVMPLWVDMLRNEKPVYGYINTAHPEWTSISTSNEPVGEEET